LTSAADHDIESSFLSNNRLYRLDIFFVGTEKLAANHQVVLFKGERIAEVTVLPALQQTEDYLASSRILKQQLEQQQQAVSAASREVLQGWACFFKQDNSSMNSTGCPIVALTYPRSYFSAVIRMVGAVVNWFTALVAGSKAPLACRDPTL
jgi:hypothetical protein